MVNLSSLSIKLYVRRRLVILSVVMELLVKDIGLPGSSSLLADQLFHALDSLAVLAEPPLLELLHLRHIFVEKVPLHLHHLVNLLLLLHLHLLFVS